MSTADAGSDTGAARERTALAWQRTALSLVAAAAIMSRLTWEHLGVQAVGVLAAAALLSAWVFVESRVRHSSAKARPAPDRGGRAAALLASATALIAATELVALAVA